MTEDITIRCHCGRLFEVPVELAGVDTKCPGCDRVIHVPASTLDSDEMPGIRQDGVEHDFTAMDDIEVEKGILDRPLREVMQAQAEAAKDEPKEEVEIAPEKGERYCAECRHIIPIRAQRCEKCGTIYCIECSKRVKLGRPKCKHCGTVLYRTRPEKGWPRRERAFVCKKCECLPSRVIELCYACGEPYELKTQSSWPVAPSSQKTGGRLGLQRATQRHGREGIRMAAVGWAVGFVGVLVGLALILPKTELGGKAWIVMVWAGSLALAGRGAYVGWIASRAEGEERWSSITAMAVGGLVLIPLLAPHILLPSVSRAGEEEDHRACTENLGDVWKAFGEYRRKNENRIPPLSQDRLYAALSDHLSDTTRQFRCPAQPGESHGYETYEESAPLPDEILMSEGRNFPILWDREANHPSGRNVLFLSGRIERMEEDEFMEVLRQSEDRVRKAREDGNSPGGGG